MDTDRAMTPGEQTLAASLFGDAIDYDKVTIRNRRWWPFQPRNIAMAPCGHLHVPPGSTLWSEDYSQAGRSLQGLLLHELTHVWQTQKRGRYYLVLMRHPFCHYAYSLKAGWPFERYGLEQQAEIVRHVFLLRHGIPVVGAPPLETLEGLLPFRPG